MHATLKNVFDDVSSVVFGKEKQIKLALTCILAKGHLLIEDLPGMGKTSLSHALAISLGLSYQRIQFTSDLLPADIIGVSVLDRTNQIFSFHQGPLFNQTILADEINRAGPKTQSALLEAMEEKQVSVDGTTYPLPEPFFVIATQNPVHQSGTFPLPESQLDRFLMRINLGYPDREAEKKILSNSAERSIKILQPRIDPNTLLKMQAEVLNLKVADVVLEYVLDLVASTRENQQYALPLSPRASLATINAAKGWAYLSQRDYVIPEDVQAILPSVIEHRLTVGDGLQQSGLSTELIKSVVVPV